MNDILKIRQALSKISEGMDLLRPGPANYYLTKMEQQIGMLFDRFCPFHPGDRVRLKVTRVIDEKHNSGWLGSKHFLVKGAVGTVAGADTMRDIFCLDVIFDDETSLIDGKERPVACKHRYCFYEDELEKANDKTGSSKA